MRRTRWRVPATVGSTGLTAAACVLTAALGVSFGGQAAGEEAGGSPKRATGGAGTQPAEAEAKREARAARIVEEAGAAEERAADLRRAERSHEAKAAARERKRDRQRREREEAARTPGPWGGYPWAWGWGPWYGVPQTYNPYAEYPPPITHVPRLGLQYNYPWAYQMGIRVPDDSSPLDHPPNLGPFVGVVQAAKERLEAEARAAIEEAGTVEVSVAEVREQAIELMRDGDFQRAGRLLADGFAASDDPRLPILLAEVFFALEKPDHAEALLRHGLGLRGALAAFPKDASKHFPSDDDFEARLARLESKESTQLLRAYLLVHSKDPERGVEVLRKLTTEKPDDMAAALLYRLYVKAAIPK